MWYWLFKYIFMGPLLSFLGRPKVEGLEHVPHSGPAILASNHLAVAVSFFLPLVVRRRITFLAKAEYFTGKGLKGAFNRWFYTVAGQEPIDRTNAAHQDEPARRLELRKTNADHWVLYVQDGVVIGAWPTTQADDVWANWTAPGPIEDWEATYPDESDPEGYGELLESKS